MFWSGFGFCTIDDSLSAYREPYIFFEEKIKKRQAL